MKGLTRNQSFAKAAALALCASLVVPLAGCSTAASTAPGVQKVVVETVGQSGLKKAHMAVGRVMGDTESAVMSKISGRVVRVQAEIGQEVKAGQPLIFLDDKDYNAALAQAIAGLQGAEARLADTQKGTRTQQRRQIEEKIQSAKAALDNAKLNLDRVKALFASGAVSQSQLDAASLAYTQAETAYQSALQELSLSNEGATKETLASLQATVAQMRAAVEAAQLNKNNTVITAPISGKIAAKNIHEGETAAPGVPLLTIVSREPVVEAYVPEDQINSIKVGQTLKVRIEQVSSEPFDAKVLAISPMANAVSKEYPVKLSLPGDPDQWKSGMYAEVTLPDASSKTVTVPDEAIVKRGSERIVMVTDGKKAMARPVITGASDGTNVEILSGLQAGEKVIVVGQDVLKDGAPVQVINEKVNGK
ncbi:efflux RND transporter periplasmic adaptor subunit [Brevibacillus sp. SYP-B805]|uniref:efflux RND transporter periplasmic adaptor subunit n=1 Tax=Brevibacillus sp. SYP-B805 TaxID=1578199 RepID=UPI0013EA4858|nr:efflux RND transporter periplasmic adaptor subunit [Brevibacillus sp. SYP-B805]